MVRSEQATSSGAASGWSHEPGLVGRESPTNQWGGEAMVTNRAREKER